ncbi:MAG: DegQ family serine endoprotease [Nitrospirales bacterium]|nr:DegQ family serine endoprotease [Nitrospira sp.]MDR4500564.1 DegQ family serine endoprotease [Nitrospirales bacterium]
MQRLLSRSRPVLHVMNLPKLGLWGLLALWTFSAFVQCSEVPGNADPVAEATASTLISNVEPQPMNVASVSLPSNDTFIKVSKEAMASVVNIASSRNVAQSGQSPRSPFFDDPFFRRFFGEEFERQFEQPKRKKEQGLGSGVIVRPDGYIVTNNHVVEKADELTVLFSDKRKFPAKLIGTDPKTDLAVIKVDATDLPTLPWGDSNALQVGEMVLAVGNPFGLNQTVTMGIISAVGRANVGIVDYENFIQTDAAINPGNSGGALVNLSGQLIGINTAIFSRTGGYMGIGFAIPSRMVKNVMESLIGHGKVIRGWLGVSIQELTSDLANQFDVPDTAGALVGDVFSDSPAGRAGVQRGDIIRNFNGKPVRDPTQLRALVAETPPNSEVTMSVWRDGNSLDLQVDIGEMPKDVAELSSQPDVESTGNHVLSGITVEPLPPQKADDGRGVLITRVAPDSSAGQAGLRNGDILLEVNRKSLRNIEDFTAIAGQLDEESAVLVLLKRGKRTIFLTIKP